MNSTKYVLVGGFLGAGKTTAIIAMARHLSGQGRRVALIANDQSDGLVDTARMQAEGFRVEEITGGCFCCRFDDLLESSMSLAQGEHPEILIAEPVGSCTDIQATVSYPLRRYFGDAFTVAPFSVLVDPHRCGALLGLWGQGRFSDKVDYVYRKQLEEADILVIHKSDMIGTTRTEQLATALHEQFPHADIVAASSVTGEGLESWYDRLLNGALGDRPTMEIDYDLYAEGEARLGWVNVRGVFDEPNIVGADALVVEICNDLTARLDSFDAEIAHLKVTLTPSNGVGLAAASVTVGSGEATLTSVLDGPVAQGELIVNLRAEADPAALRREVEGTLDALLPSFVVSNEAAFRPDRPVPTHRLTAR